MRSSVFILVFDCPETELLFFELEVYLSVNTQEAISLDFHRLVERVLRRPDGGPIDIDIERAAGRSKSSHTIR